jgi:deoxyuridine 5'-triphosphate nucleotidohydrolase
MTVQELQALQQTNPDALADLYCLKFVKTHADAVLPKRNHDDPVFGDSGYDVTAVEDALVPANGAIVVPVGLKLAQVPPGFWIRIESRSGLQFKHNISAFNGIIDNNYRGDMGVRLINNSDVDYQVKKGDRVAQLVLYPLVAVVPENVFFTEEVSETARGEKGFGSSGK